MTYNDFIQNIINTRGQWNIPDGTPYENHHILPICKGGLPLQWSHDTKHENLIWLTLEEHFTAHKLLYYENKDDKSLCQAFMMMSKYENLTEGDYLEAKQAGPWNKGLTKETDDRVARFAEAQIGKNTWTKGLIRTEETRQKISSKLKIYNVNNPGIHAGENNPMYGKNAYEGKSEEEMQVINNKKSIANKKRYKDNKYKWYTNGINNTMSVNCPIGYWEGTTPSAKQIEYFGRLKKLKNTHWYNNGIQSKQFVEGQQPDGWVRGRLYNHATGGWSK